MTSHTFAAVSPWVRAVSAIATRGSGVVESGEAPGATAAASPALTSGPPQAAKTSTNASADEYNPELRVISKHLRDECVVLFVQKDRRPTGDG